jgi:hypothetical protein
MKRTGAGPGRCGSVAPNRLGSETVFPFAHAGEKISLALTIASHLDGWSATRWRWAESAFPPPIALVQRDIVPGDPQHELLAQRNYHFVVVNSIHHSDSPPERCHSVAGFQTSLLLLAQIMLLAQVDDVIQTFRVIPSTVLPQRNAFAVPKHEDVGAERDQRMDSRRLILRA